MRAYGVQRKDRGCCPGHDKFPAEHYHMTRATSASRRDRAAKRRARQEARREIAGAW